MATALRWLHNLGVDVIKNKGTYVDCHERDDVEYCKKFFRKMVSNGFLNKDNAPTPEAASCLTADLGSPSQEQFFLKRSIICHDESTFQANEESWLWGVKGQHVIRPKSCGAGIMVSDFINEYKDIFDSQKKSFQPL